MVGFAHTIEKTLKLFSKKYEIDCFIETGTFKGKTIEMASNIFSKNYTIELNEKLYNQAKEKLKNKKNINFILGDSSKKIKEIIKDLTENSIFFLDAHWAGPLSSKNEKDSPILEELKIISTRLNKFKDIIIIDDISFIGIKKEFKFTKEMKSQYFPKGGLFKTNWTHITKEKIHKIFPHSKIKEENDRMIIQT